MTTHSARASRFIRLAVVAALLLGTLVWPTNGSPADAAPPPLTPYPGGRWEPGPAQYGSETVTTTVTMDDGVELSATIGYPTSLETGERVAGNFPVIIQPNPYGDAVIPYFVQRGYVFATVRPRGTGTSGGDVGLASPRDLQDGALLVDWAAHKLDGSEIGRAHV